MCSGSSHHSYCQPKSGQFCHSLKKSSVTPLLKKSSLDNELISTLSLLRLLRSAVDRTCGVPRTRNTYGDKTFNAAGPLAWDNQPPYIKQGSNYKPFNLLFFFFLFSVACILTERSRVHDAALGDAVLNTSPGRVEVKLQRNKILLHNPQPRNLGLPGGGFHSWLRQMFRVAEIACQWSPHLPIGRHDQSSALCGRFLPLNPQLKTFHFAS